MGLHSPPLQPVHSPGSMEHTLTNGRRDETEDGGGQRREMLGEGGMDKSRGGSAVCLIFPRGQHCEDAFHDR